MNYKEHLWILWLILAIGGAFVICEFWFKYELVRFITAIYAVVCMTRGVVR